MGRFVSFTQMLWRWAGNASLAQWIISICGGSIMGILTWIGDQPTWGVALVALVSWTFIMIGWSRTTLLRATSRAPTINQPDKLMQVEPGAAKEPKVGVQLFDTQDATLGTISVKGPHDIGVNIERSKGLHIGTVNVTGGSVGMRVSGATSPKPAPSTLQKTQKD